MDERFNHWRRISGIFETDDFTKANERLDNGWDLMKSIVSNGKCFYILVQYEEDEKCERTNIAASPLEQMLKTPR